MSSEYDNLPKDKVTSSNSSTSSTDSSSSNATSSSSPVSSIVNLSPEEIQTTFDKDAPIVVFFGSQSSGKTVSIMRLIKYLRENGYMTNFNKRFQVNNKNYQTFISEFENKINAHEAPKSTGAINFMLLDIFKSAKKICQVFEAPGEAFFDLNNPHSPIMPYFQSVVNSKNRKVYVFIMELEWLQADQSVLSQYQDRVVSFLKKDVSAKDSVVLMINKADQNEHLFVQGKPNIKSFFEEAKKMYPILFAALGSKGLFSSFRIPHNRVVFSSGVFYDKSGGGQVWTRSKDEFPQHLWEEISSSLRGGW